MDLAGPHMAGGRQGGSSKPALLDSAASSNDLVPGGGRSPAKAWFSSKNFIQIIISNFTAHAYSIKYR